ncbi:MAG: hypothetical protein US75_C0005G0004 [Candidatus Woesebacteria bacterium GW2011_GWC1_38_13]|uniref:Uncharacterized protein n=2 Tax=Candidatus Woeseibacteriota TaxID=1752722 RepID=A0A0G0KV31_9BACT|nr:MAG: hypothetical protein US75_C0005G0004 [Candidatus Woesebacteria bacterium GW2011_GWC1_38_13]KKQ82602.1 MAG: hypothetical protein UT06_C0044G0003 [Candidatus Woesebacteria bacterium GW2011_GWA1_38_8]
MFVIIPSLEESHRNLAYGENLVLVLLMYFIYSEESDSGQFQGFAKP